MSRIESLVEECLSWQKAKKNLAVLSKCTLEEKRELVYPAIIALTAEYLRGEREDKGYALKTYTEFLLRELDEEPELAAKLFASLGGPISIAAEDWSMTKYFYGFVVDARDPRAQSVLRDSPGDDAWANAVIAIDGQVLANEVLTRVSAGNARCILLAPAAGFLCGARARSALDELFAQGGHLQPWASLGIALLADPRDAKWFKQLSTSGDGASAKRLFAALTHPRPLERLKAIDTITRSIRKTAPNAILLGLCRLIEDELPEIAAAAALALREYARLGKKASNVHHAVLLRTAFAAASRGLTQKARGALEAVIAKIPRSESLPDGPTLEPTKRRRPKKKAAKQEAPLPPRSPETEAWFLMAIREAPRDNAPRLVYADWLLEHQDPRGEFIQIQCLLGRAIWGAKGEVREPNADVPNSRALEKREAKLYQTHRKHWMAPTAGAVRKWRWRRGFIEGFTAGGLFFEHASTIFAAHPIVELSLEGLKRNDFDRLARTELPGLEALALAYQHLTPAVLDALLDAQNIRALERLDLRGNSLGEEGARAIAAKMPPTLTTLGLAYCQVGGAGLRAILDTSAPTLEAICVAQCDLADYETAIREHPRGKLVRVVGHDDPMGRRLW